MNVLSLFDGISCGMIALEKAGIKVDNYFASEIDKYAIKVSQHNYPKIIRLGDVTKWREWKLPKIDLVLAGSPCQGFSIAGKKLNFEDERSKLFFEFVSVIEKYNPNYWLLENVATMSKEVKEIIDENLNVKGVLVNSNSVSAQNRKRYYWTNINFEKPLNESGLIIENVLENDSENHIYMKIEKLKEQVISPSETDGVITLNPKRSNGKQTYQQDRIYDYKGKMPALTATLGNRFYIKDNKDKVRKLSIREQARLQKIPDKFSFDNCSDLHASKMIGNGWTIDVIADILSNINSLKEVYYEQ